MNNVKEALRKIRNAYQINRNSEKVITIYALTDLKAGICSDAIEKADLLLEKNKENKEAKLIKANALINIKKPQEALNILLPMEEEEKTSRIVVYLSYLAYKILVEENPTNYNENMLNLYLEKVNTTNNNTFDKNEISEYIEKALNINKG